MSNRPIVVVAYPGLAFVKLIRHALERENFIDVQSDQFAVVRAEPIQGQPKLVRLFIEDQSVDRQDRMVLAVRRAETIQVNRYG